MSLYADMANLAEEKANKLKAVGERLAESARWAPYVGDLKGIDRVWTAILLENQARHMASTRPQLSVSGGLNETTKLLNVGSFDKFAFPIIRAVYPKLIANEIVSVQPMSGPTSMVFYMDYILGTTKGNLSSGTSIFNPRTGPLNTEYYSSGTVPQLTPARTSGTPDTDTFVTVLSPTPIKPGTLSGSFAETTSGTTRSFADDGNGNVIGTGVTSGTIDYTTGALVLAATSNNVDDSTVVVTYDFDTEASSSTPMIDLQLTSSSVTAEVRKLKANWSLEASQNLQALHGIDAEAELVGVLAEVIKYEIDRQVINDLYNFAGAGSVVWDKATPANVSYAEHKLTLADAFIQGSQLIYSATKRGQANFAVIGTSVANVIESHPQFKPESKAFDTQSNTGVVKMGSFLGRFSLYKDPNFPTDKWVMGYKGNGFMDAGYAYCPYVPLITTPTVVLDDFLGRKGAMTQYGVKTINNKMYSTGQIINA
jgi:hypothetical protein